MRRQPTIGSVGWLVLVGIVATANLVVAQDASGPRNIVFIFTDDQRYDGLGLRDDYFNTPHLDRLADGASSLKTRL